MNPAPLALSLDHAAAILGAARLAIGPVLARSASADLLIDLPPAGAGASGTMTAATLAVMGSLYFAAEIEGTYLPAVAEQLAEHRFALNLTDRSAADAIEGLAREIDGQWVDRRLRNQIFLRCFGLGEADPNLGDSAANREFEPLFARWCGAIATTAREQARWGGTAGGAVRVAVAAQAMLGNLDNRMQGNTLIVAERLTRQLQLSVTALNHPGMTALFMGRTAWDVVRGVLGDGTPDMSRLVTRAQCGLRLLSWQAAHLAAVQDVAAQAVIDAMAAEAGLQGWAEMWLDATGITPTPAAPPAGPRWLQ